MHPNLLLPARASTFLFSCICACGVYDIESRFEGDTDDGTPPGVSTVSPTTGATGAGGGGSMSTSGGGSTTEAVGRATESTTTSTTTVSTSPTEGSSGATSWGDTIEGATAGEGNTTAGEQDLMSAKDIMCPGMGEQSIGSWVFVSDDLFAGDISHDWSADINSGAQRGDVYCQCAARKAGLAGGYVAWLSTSDLSISQFLSEPRKTARHFVRRDDEIGCIAASWDAFFENKLLLPINFTQSGIEIKPYLWDTNNHRVWTGTTTGGDTTGMDCDGWSTTELLGTAGKANRTSSKWTDSGSLSCSTSIRLYCIQISEDRIEDYAAHCPDIFMD